MKTTNVPAARQPVAAPPKDAEWRVLIAGLAESRFQEVRRGLASLESGWLVEQAGTCAAGLQKLDSSRFDAVLFYGPDPLPPEEEAGLSDRTDRCIFARCCPTAQRNKSPLWHQPGFAVLAEDAPPEIIAHTLKRTAHLRDWMKGRHVKKLIAQIRKLPAVPELYSKISAELQSPDGSMDVVAAHISREPVMSAKMFQVVNSAFFGMNEEVTDPVQAVMLLGAARVRSLILMAGVFSQFDTTECPGFAPETVWNHSLRVANYARLIAQTETRDSKVVDAAFSAGLLHDVGKLILAGNLPRMYNTVLKTRETRRCQDWRAELEVLGTTHAELGACLLATWGISLPILLAIAFHHNPDEAGTSGFTSLTAVCAANLFAHVNGKQEAEALEIGESLSIVANQNVSKDSLKKWREACRLDDDGTPAS